MTTCDLCDLPTPSPPVTGDGGEYCCPGCRAVADRLGDTRVDDEPAPTGPATDPDGEEAFLAVDGMHCASCETFVEATATRRDGVLAASANYPTGILRVVYDPDVIDRDDLPAAIDRLGYTAREVDSEAASAGGDGRLLVGGFFAMMIMVWYALFLYPTYLGLDPAIHLIDVAGEAGTYLVWNLWVMASVVVFYTGAPILRGAYVSVNARQPNMDLLIAIAAGTAYLYSAIAVLVGHAEVYFDVAVVIVLAVSLGRRYEERLRRRAVGRLTEMTRLRVDSARLVTDDGRHDVAVDDLEAGDRVVVRSGERVPVDGTVVEGTAAVDESFLTGESRPIEAGPGDAVVGGAAVRDGGVTVAVDDAAGSTLDRLVRSLLTVQSDHRGVQHLADRLAAVFVPSVLLLATVVTAWQLLVGPSPTRAVLAGLTVLVVSCPCALGLATPLAVSAGVRAALASGIVVTDGTAVERAAAIDVVALDKTGTLTTGQMTLRSWTGESGLLRRAAAVEQFSDHPVATAILDARQGRPAAGVTSVTTHPGRGIEGVVGGDRVVVGGRDLMTAEGIAVPREYGARYNAATRCGDSPALVAWDGAVRGVVVAAEEPRDEWASVVADIAGGGRDVVVLSGDAGPTLDPFREHPDVGDVFEGVPPEGKAAVIARLRDRGRVAMIGDGSNDAPALAAADLGIVLERGTRLAADAADVVVATDDLRSVPRVFEYLAVTRRRVRGNLAWAFVYNAVAIPLAVTGALNPLLAAGAMAASSLLVVANSARPYPANPGWRDEPADSRGSVAGPAPTDPNELNG